MAHDLAYIAKIAKRIFTHNSQNDLPNLFLLNDIERNIDFQSQLEIAPIGSCVILRNYGDISEIIDLIPPIGVRIGASISSNPKKLSRNITLHIPNKFIKRFRIWSLQNHILTTSAHNIYEILKAKNAGYKNIMVSPLFKTNSPSSKYKRPISIIRIAKLARDFPNLNFIGLGGINSKNIKRLKNTNVKAIAGVSFVSKT